MKYQRFLNIASFSVPPVHPKLSMELTGLAAAALEEPVRESIMVRPLGEHQTRLFFGDPAGQHD